MKPPILHLTVSLNNIQYVLGSLSFNLKNEQFSYHFAFPEKTPGTCLNLTTSNKTSRLDHITWHSNCVHLKDADDNIIEEFYYTDGPLIQNRPCIMPLYIESIYLANGLPFLPNESSFPPWSNGVNQRILSSNTSEGFSMIILMVPNTWNTPQVLKTQIGLNYKNIKDEIVDTAYFADLCSEIHRPGRACIFSNWDIVILTSKYLIKSPTDMPIDLVGGMRMFNFKHIPDNLNQLFIQAKFPGSITVKCLNHRKITRSKLQSLNVQNIFNSFITL